MLEPQNLSINNSKQHKICRSTEVEASKIVKCTGQLCLQTGFFYVSDPSWNTSSGVDEEPLLPSSSTGSGPSADDTAVSSSSSSERFMLEDFLNFVVFFQDIIRLLASSLLRAAGLELERMKGEVDDEDLVVVASAGGVPPEGGVFEEDPRGEALALPLEEDFTTFLL